MGGNCLIGCDIGTSGTKSVVMDTEGNILGEHYIEYVLITSGPTKDKFNIGVMAEHRPEEDYWYAVSETMKVAIRQAKKADSNFSEKDILGISVSELSPVLILVDKDLKPLQNGHIWMDRRGVEQVKFVEEKLGYEHVFKRSANTIDPYFGIIKLLWEKDNRPNLYDKSKAFLNAKDYANMKLTGKTDVKDYSNCTLDGITFDAVKREWNDDDIETLGLDRSKFPDAFACDEVIGEVNDFAAKAIGIPKGVPVVAGTVDCNAAWVANKVIDVGDNCLVMGTAGVWGCVHEEPKFTDNMITIIHTADSKKKYTTLAALVACGFNMRWFRDRLGQEEIREAEKRGMDPYQIMDEEAETAPLGSDRLVFLPYYMGERTPIWDTEARGLWFGLSDHHTKAHIIRAMMESVGYGIRQCYEMTKASGLKIDPTMTLGEGGARSAIWRQIICDICNVKGKFITQVLGAPVGDAICAGVGVGQFSDYGIVKKWESPFKTIDPIEKNHINYTKLYKIYLKLYPAVKDLYKDLAFLDL